MTYSKNYSGIRGLFLLVVCWAIVNLSTGEQKVCGANLRSVLEMECPNGYNRYKTKRSSLSPEEDLSIESTEDDFNFGLTLDMLPLLTNMGIDSGIAKLRRRRHGITHECCSRPCTVKEIQSYCL